MEEEAIKLCLICGVDANKKKRHDRYNYIPSLKQCKKGKFQKEESNTDSDDSLINSKKKTQRSSSRVAAAGGSRQTRSRNPKSFAASLCKAMELPHTPDHPFLQIFSRADYCAECMNKIRDIHEAQVELESIQAKITEARVDFELDLSKHLASIPCRVNFEKNVRKIGHNWERYKEDIKLILDYNENERKASKLKAKANKEENEDEDARAPRRERRQAAINSTLKMKRKLEENDSDDEEDEDEDDELRKTKKKKKNDGGDKEFLPDDTTSSETEKEDPDSSVVDIKEESSSNSADNTSNDAVKEEEEKIKEEDVVEVVKAKKDPNLKCPHCPVPRYFEVEAKLEEHVIRAHNHKCDLCDKTFIFESELKKHKVAHVKSMAEEKVAYICGFCDQEFQLKKYLEDHLDQHPEAKPLNCQQCGRGFSRKESLQKAFQIYKGEPVEPCRRCGRNLNLKDYLEHNSKLKQS